MNTLTEKLLTHSWSLTDCLPPVGRPCQSQRYGCCSFHPGAGFLASGLCDCTNPTETFSLLVKMIAFQHSFNFNAWKSGLNINHATESQVFPPIYYLNQRKKNSICVKVLMLSSQAAGISDLFCLDISSRLQIHNREGPQRVYWVSKTSNHTWI